MICPHHWTNKQRTQAVNSQEKKKQKEFVNLFKCSHQLRKGKLKQKNQDTLALPLT